jgi:transcriptional regulator NrdR family protein
MQCPQCSGDTTVYGTTKVGQSVLRYRRCLACGHAFRTAEGSWDKPVKARKKFVPQEGPSLFDEGYVP